MPQVRLARNGGPKIPQDWRIIFRVLPSEEGADQWLQFQGLSKPLAPHGGNAIRHQRTLRTLLDFPRDVSLEHQAVSCAHANTWSQ
jgi:hypothetical protein